ncbi:Acb2/Tad1 domain-containing protein [Methylomonas rapida]|uniref:Acb2/Tad1 hairpin domain-containing protein n=1 Tax=Methylomonas rapida TaxID=2963939 RepID=A0ABY7GFN1_9GAMM|nr:hypothetical protein [Methylomonas rapida]WAR42925.1 hypothetical protein NM686_010975 [Methylomonas rapida]
MENQHRHIKGYRELSQEEIDLMNRIKVKGEELLSLHAELSGRLSTDHDVKLSGARRSMEGKEFNGVPYNEHTGASDECHEFRRFIAAEPQRWSAIGKTDIQTGIMALVRAIAQPSV